MAISNLFRFRSRFHHQKGLTLIEVLVAVVILAVGLLGLAGLQVLGLKNISISGTHANAAILANSLAERIYVNADNIADYATLTSSSCPSAASIALMDYCDVYARASGDLNGDGDITDAGETRLLRPSSGSELITVAACGACTGTGMQTITLTWTEQDFAGADQERAYSINFKP